jgi:hypothetical protein
VGLNFMGMFLIFVTGTSVMWGMHCTISLNVHTVSGGNLVLVVLIEVLVLSLLPGGPVQNC